MGTQNAPILGTLETSLLKGDICNRRTKLKFFEI
jgi:hypothetical protein